jgi:hypothetical protein
VNILIFARFLFEHVVFDFWCLICVEFALDAVINENWENDDSCTASSVYFPTLLGLKA